MIWRTLVVLLVVLLAGVGFLLYWTADANRFKPELESLLAEQTGIPVVIEGDLSWRLFPPLILTAEGISADQEGQQWSVARLALDLDVMTVIETRDVDQWRVQSLELSDVVMLEDGDQLRVHALDLRDFRFGQPSRVNTTLDYTPDYAAEGATPIPLTMTALVTYHPEPEKVEVTQGEFETDMASGTCNLDIFPVSDPGELPASSDDDLVSVALLRSFDWQGECQLDRLTVEDQQFDRGVATLVNEAAVASTTLDIPEFFGGKATVLIDIDASQSPLRWRLTPTLADVDSELLMAWLDQRLEWIAALAYGGSIEFTGNTQAEALASMAGKTQFDGGQGAISITKIKAPLLKVATLLKEPERISGWPDLWNYERLVGSWNIEGSEHTLDFALDNLTVTADGTYDILEDQMDMLAELQFTTLADGQMFDVNPLLMDLPIPIRCVGAANEPSCGLVADAAQRIVAKVLTSDENSALRAKLDEKIEEEVPEQYRDAARGLLDLLGNALENKQEQ